MGENEKEKKARERERERERKNVCVYTCIYAHIHNEQAFHLTQLTATMMFILQNIYMISLPIAMIFTTIAMILPCWWSSETFQVGLWRARSIPSSSWIRIEPDIAIREGKCIQSDNCFV